jgi:hypothetical protein
MNRLIDARILLRAALAGVVLQFVLAAIAHFSPWVATHLLLFGRMMCAATAGYLYGMMLGRSYALGAFGGAIAGGLCAVPAIALSVLVGDSEASMVSVGTGICILTGGVGGAFGHMAAIMRKLGL